MADSRTAQQVSIDQDVWLSAADHDYRLRIYRPQTNSTGVIFLWAHGGAWIGGDLEMAEADGVSRRVAGFGITVVSVDYTLAPRPAGWPAEEAPPSGADRPRAGYPVASVQLAAAFDWVVEHATDLGGAADKIGIGGASAGGNLAASAALRLRDAGGQQPAAVILSYPALHATHPPIADELLARLADVPQEDQIDPDGMPDLTANYAGTARDEPYAFPGSHDVARLPRTLIVNADLDTLRPSGELFAAELAGTGGDVRVLAEQSTIHGYLNNPDDPAVPITIARMVRWLTE
ncbi:alpha/beta hydrolase [Microlunatus soli]|uniref:Acetyl esterase/lipase n=1 Tax=Microlunatus soli TaxID=630515 RepID=A0A1H2A4Y2_9ACTN|nr:alpha/beta hydrolase fold domain-containing protein [Microlunatus soli]SDT40923.1 Acetyl esterase/lipase [Microlunatus soli]